ncbi:cupin domain-containing protein [Sulfurirhabdus autotrophica]|uniref:cupin domain-containing protein n=1 Tax=Sulfurirhabdus autotrophica TaxID=1706046 RepID=UPI001404E3F3|nr:cupin domain-containing protein [Sulfurirhabdus autotrophica]
MAPFETIELAKCIRHDIYIISGTLYENTHGHRAGSFLRRGTNSTLAAGAVGSLLFINRDAIDNACRPETIAGDDLVWFFGYLQGMRVAYLAKSPHQLSLVLWQPGTRVHAHTHPFGEEILVLKGELCDEKGAYPAGCWLRFLQAQAMPRIPN